MATSLNPESTNPTADSSAQSPVPPTESTPAAIPPTTLPQGTPTDPDRYTSILEATLREQNARIQALQAERTAPAPVAPTAPAPQATAADFFNDPHAALRDFRDEIKNELHKTVAPLQDFVRSMRGEGTPYGNVKQQFLSDPRYSAVLADPKVSYAVDEIMKNQQATPEMMKAAIIQASGLKATGELDVALVATGVDLSRFNTPAVPTQTPQPPMSIPAHMRPSAPAAPVQQAPTAAQEPLSELQKRLARERGQTEEQYRAWLNVKPGEVASSTIGRPTK